MSKTSPKLFCFVLMPFTSDFEDIYNIGIKETCIKAGTYCERVDEQIFHERILDRIYNQIAKADLIIADMTGRNANVFYEVGYAHALNKPTILLTKAADDIPFDLKHFPHIIYDSKISVLREGLAKKLEWVLNNRTTTNVEMKTPVDLYVEDQNLSAGNITFEVSKHSVPKIELVIYNNSQTTLKVGAFKIGIITPDFEKVFNPNIITTRLPDKTFLHMLPFKEVLFPGAYGTTSISFSLNSNNSALDEHMFTIRLFSERGYQDYPLTIRKVIDYTNDEYDFNSF